jgi:hypothetical protein
MSSSEQNSFEYQTVANNLNLTETGGADADADADDCESGESSLRSGKNFTFLHSNPVSWM